MKFTLISSLFALGILLWGCSSENVSGGNETFEGRVNGVSQKGPFLEGSSVVMQELDGNSLAQTGKSFRGKVINDKGDFSIENVSLDYPYALLEVNGYFYNEVTGENSEGMISLNALTDLTNRNNVNVNVLTHLETDRVLNLVQKQGMSFTKAKKQAESEIYSSFGFLSNTESPEDMDIFSLENGGDALLALSVLMLGNCPVADFSERLALAARSFAENGNWHGLEKDETADWAYQIERGSLGEFENDSEGKVSLSKIYDNVNSWIQRDNPHYLYFPTIDGFLYKFWTNEYNLGQCNRNHAGNKKKVTNIHSKYYNKDFVCYYSYDYSCTDDDDGFLDCRWYLAEDPF